jgi:hypothetical protein
LVEWSDTKSKTFWILWKEAALTQRRWDKGPNKGRSHRPNFGWGGTALAVGEKWLTWCRHQGESGLCRILTSFLRKLKKEVRIHEPITKNSRGT